MLLGTVTLTEHDSCRNLIASAVAGTVKPDRIIVVDQTGEFVVHEHQDIVTVYRPGHNIGWSAGCNWLLREANDGDILICNDDVELLPNTLEAFLAWRIGKTAPLYHTFPGAFYCFFCNAKEFTTRCGSFDEKFYPFYYEDFDMFYRMKLRGTGPGYCHTAHVKHNVMATTGKAANYDDVLARNKAYYMEKWGGEPFHETYTKAFNKVSVGEDNMII